MKSIYQRLGEKDIKISPCAETQCTVFMRPENGLDPPYKGQVPMDNFKALLIGDGRLAGHLINLLHSHSLPWTHWSRKNSASKSFASELDDLAKDHSVALLAVSDSAIEPLALQLPKELTKIHFSGALHSELAIGIHPLMTFGSELFPLSFYPKIPLVMDSKAQNLKWVQKLPNPKYTLSPEQKTLYHAICHLSGNYSKLLWDECFRSLESSTSIPREAFSPYLSETLRQVILNKADLMAGPFGRGDQETIYKHTQELQSHPSLEKFYSHFLESFKERFPK